MASRSPNSSIPRERGAASAVDSGRRAKHVPRRAVSAGSPLVCANCNAENRAGRRFCAQCGAALPIICPTCGFANEPGEKFCGGCGGPLAVTVAPAVAGRRARPAEAERRPVTVLFADLCGYTRLSQALDPEDIHQMLERFFGVVDAIVERFGG